MKIRPKVPVCTDCDHVFEYKGQNPGQLGGVVVQFGEAYCTKKKKPRKEAASKKEDTPI